MIANGRKSVHQQHRQLHGSGNEKMQNCDSINRGFLYIYLALSPVLNLLNIHWDMLEQ